MSGADLCIPDVLVKRLELWTSQLIKISSEMEQRRLELANFGIIIGKEKTINVRPEDRPVVIRIKEQLIRLERKRTAIVQQMAGAGAEILDERTLEVILPNGPRAGSYLSWLPGEPQIAWWRESKQRNTPRLPLPGIEQNNLKPVYH